MTLPTPTPLENESLPAFRAFVLYTKMGKSRSIRRCACRLRKACTTIARFSKKYHWQQRLAELTAQAAIEENERRAVADAEAKRKFAERIEAEKLRFVQRQIEVSEAITCRALQLLSETDGNDAARLFDIADSIGASAVGLHSASSASFELQSNVHPVINTVVVQKDEISDRAEAGYYRFFKAHPEYPQACTFLARYEQDRNARGLPLDWPPEEQPCLTNGADEQ